MDASLSWRTRVRMLLALLLVPLVPVVTVAAGTVALGLPLYLFLALGDALPEEGGLLLTFGFGLLAAVIQQWRSGRRALGRGLRSPLHDLPTRPADDELAGAVDRLAAQADVEPPAVRVVETDAPEAFTVRHEGQPTVAVSEGVLDALSAAELRGVLAHELAHLQSRDLAVMRWATLPLAVADELWTLADETREEGDWPVVEMVMAATTGRCGSGCAGVVSVGREYAADAGAAEITGEPAALASALVTLDEQVRDAPRRDLRHRADVLALNVVPDGSRGLLSTHPPTEQRVERLRSMAGDS